MQCAVWHGPGDLRVERRPVPQPTGSQVLIRVAACGICGTDLHLVDGWLTHHRPPMVLGHEVAGVVAAVGPEVSHLRVGDPVSPDPNIFCGACFYCRESRPFLCPHRRTLFGGFAEYLAVPEQQAYLLPDGLPLMAGSLAEPLSCCLHATDLAGVRAGDTAAVLGAGPIGLLLVQLLLLCGVREILVTDPEPARRSLALELGATRALDPTAEPVPAAARTLGSGIGPDHLFEASGAQAAISQAPGLVRKGGTVVLLGLPAPDVRIEVSPHDLILREVRVQGAWVRGPEYHRAVAMLPRLHLTPFLANRVPLADMERAIRLARGRGIPKVLVEPGQPSHS